MDLSKFEQALQRFHIYLRPVKGRFYLKNPPVAGAFFTLTESSKNSVTFHFFDSLMGSVAPSGKPVSSPAKAREMALVIHDRITQWNTAVLARPRGASQNRMAARVVRRYLTRAGADEELKQTRL